MREAVSRRSGAYHSRNRGLWIKGESSGDTQELLAIDLDCDRDTIRFTVRQRGAGFCHLKTDTCWGDVTGMNATFKTVVERLDDAPAGSYTRRLFDEPELLAKKLVEEAQELADADSAENAAWEAADLIYFACVALAKAGGRLEDVDRNLDAKSLKVTRRPGNAKT
jgi:phosphoribosyl-ATP pyrophosphohydrolase